MNYAFSMGLSGSGIKLKDVEYGINIFHEELNEGKVAIAKNFDVHPSVSEDFLKTEPPLLE
ncbi:hypothetical protein [Mesonia maritima]|uniref:Uncharacterized protein n=1 Tax=Mesonia maritima TaxID=1793873 RepID=A0ABU1K8J6_9FLAO|nr:hypothetical protein [Mesonia maritima]MDR6301920.1 hypothetical protein [Mesonia maritima]